MPQDVGGGYLVNGFGAPGVNICLWDSILSIRELFLFLLCLILCLGDLFFVHRAIDFRSPGVEFLPLRVKFWLLGLNFGFSEHILIL